MASDVGLPPALDKENKAPKGAVPSKQHAAVAAASVAPAAPRLPANSTSVHHGSKNRLIAPYRARTTVPPCRDQECCADELLRLAEKLKDLSEDWTVRAKALQRLAALASLPSALFLNERTLPALQRLREPLCAQLVDQRSTLCRDACLTVTAVADAMGEQFGPFCRDVR